DQILEYFALRNVKQRAYQDIEYDRGTWSGEESRNFAGFSLIERYEQRQFETLRKHQEIRALTETQQTIDSWVRGAALTPDIQALAASVQNAAVERQRQVLTEALDVEGMRQRVLEKLEALGVLRYERPGDRSSQKIVNLSRLITDSSVRNVLRNSYLYKHSLVGQTSLARTFMAAFGTEPVLSEEQLGDVAGGQGPRPKPLF